MSDKRIMSLRERAKELDRVSIQFDNNYPFTAKWIRKLAQNLLIPRVTLDEVVKDWEDIVQTFRSEFVGSGENSKYREQSYEDLVKIIWEVINKRGTDSSKIFEKVLPALERGNEALANLAEIYLTLVSSKNLSEKGRYYGLCFMYIILTEGVYDENIRILYILKKASTKLDMEYEAIQDKNLWFFKKRLEPIFFEGWNNRVRNAIAHARFRFDSATNKMTFKDIANKFEPEYSERLSLREFGNRYYDKIDSLCRLRSYYMLLLGVRDLIFAARPFGKTKMKE